MWSNHHLRNVAGLVVGVAGMAKFGENYMTQIIKNSNALGQFLHDWDWEVVVVHKSFTEFHIILTEVSEPP